MDENLVKDFIEHHGVIGMHWGVRRGSASSKKRTSPESQRVSALKNRPKHTLTNKQLKTINERMNLETNFSKLNPGPIHKGEQIAKTILGLVGTTAAVAALAMKSPAVINSGKAAAKKILAKEASKRAARTIAKKGQQKLF